MSDKAKRPRKKVIRQSDLTPAMADVLPAPRATTWAARFAQLHPKRFFLEEWRRLDAQADASRKARAAAGKGWDWHPLGAMVVGAVCLAIMEYFGHHRGMGNGFDAFLDWTATFNHDGSPANVFGEIQTSDRWRELWGYGWWSLWRFLGYFVIPVLFIKFVFRERIVDHGLETKGFFEHAWIYGLGYAVVFVCVLGVTAFDPHFRTYYPFYNLCRRSWLDFGIWECLYALQFFSLEFFFRGFWLKSMKNSMGSQAIFAMMVPYCMIHFGKPFLETMGAIIAGIFLGTLSMKTRSIWSGFLLHVSVAITMDLVALFVTGGLPTDWLPQ